jgi:hypothetical protein
LETWVAIVSSKYLRGVKAFPKKVQTKISNSSKDTCSLNYRLFSGTPFSGRGKIITSRLKACHSGDVRRLDDSRGLELEGFVAHVEIWNCRLFYVNSVDGNAVFEKVRSYLVLWQCSAVSG